ncbi:BMP family ABC transporter substrate-binding protein [Enterococcus faecalis]|uniref:BMP family lipoprotein n=1 Tax=Enterococcus faecalis TaxID=1351 RepID=UPI001AD68AA7|nr:BMP family protein [Enterococcus faecalis]EKD5409450.1 BMP family protein [Enterococcus faecalis]MBO6448397.1 BMP family ABC transporter substrate-binding protein [Enterococcus faecalis]
MKKAKLFGFSLIALGLSVSLAACGGGKGKTAESGGGKGDAAHSAVIITDTGGVDDKSFNQSSWEGLQAWGKEHDLPEGSKGYAYIQSNDAADYTTNIDQAVSSKFNTIFGIGYLLKDAISSAADANPDTNFVLIDDQIDGKKNVVSATFRDNEAAYLAGVAAAAKELGKEITVDTKYAASFADPAKGKALAAAMYQNGVDIIFHASGATGQGVFQEAKDLNESGSGDKVWVIGVDRDQDADGKYKTKDGKEDNFTLTSTLKGVGTAVQDIANRALEDKFPGGEHLVYGLKDGGVDLTDGYLNDKTKEAVKTAKDKVISGDVKVPEKPE